MMYIKITDYATHYEEGKQFYSVNFSVGRGHFDYLEVSSDFTVMLLINNTVVITAYIIDNQIVIRDHRGSKPIYVNSTFVEIDIKDGEVFYLNITSSFASKTFSNNPA